MALRLPVLAAIVVFASVTVEVADGRGRCAPAGSKTTVDNGVVRVYEREGDYFGCAYKSGRSHRLGVADWECISSSGCHGVSGIRVAGRFVAYSEYSNDGGASATETGALSVRNLETGHSRHEHQVGQVDADAVMGGFRVTRGGSVGYIVNRTPRERSKRLLEVWRMDRRGRRRLDHGRRIAGGSLRLRRERLSWRHGPTRRSATLR